MIVKVTNVGELNENWQVNLPCQREHVRRKMELPGPAVWSNRTFREGRRKDGRKNERTDVQPARITPFQLCNGVDKISTIISMLLTFDRQQQENSVECLKQYLWKL